MEFYIFSGYKNINMLLLILFTIDTFTQYYTTLPFLKGIFIENFLSESYLILKTNTPQSPSSDGHNRVVGAMYLDTIRERLRCSEVRGGGERVNKVLTMDG